MTQQTYTPADIVKFALGKDAVNIATAFDQLAGEKVAAAIQARKIEVAKRILGGEPEEQQAEIEAEAETEVEAEVEDDTVAVEDEDNKESEESHENAEQSA